MENFILYEEIFRSEYCISYKGRRKGAIAFVAIHCIDKSKRPQTTNRVRLTHELSHINVVQFLEWYETTNHLWLVVELCTGGSLESILAQDGHLPESCIFSFGLDLVRGLHYLHSLGILFCDLQPSKILLDGPGVLKYDDFSLSKVEGESLDDLFQLTGDDSENSLDNSDAGSNASPRSRKTLGSPEYLAPEVFKGGDNSLASDFWSLGCVLYQLFTGHVPFDGNTFEDVMYSVLNRDYSPPKAKGPKICTKPSSEFCDLLAGLLDKDPTSRMDWNRMVEHPFWKGQLVPGGQSQPLQEVTNQEPVSLSDANEVTGQVTPAVLKKVNLVALTPDVGSKENLRKSSPSVVLNTSLQGGKIPARPQTSPEITLTKQAQFTLSTRPRSSMNTLEDDDNDNTSKSTRKLARKSKIKSKPDRMGGKYRGEPRKQWEEDGNVTKELMYQVWDLTVTPIVDNPKILKPAPLKYEAKSLPHTCHSPERCLKLSKRELNEHFSSVYDALVKENDKSAGGQRLKVQMLNYLGSLASNADLAQEILKSKLRVLLQQLLKANNALEIRCRAGRVLGLLALHCEELDENLPLTELFAALTEVVRDNSRNSKLKQSILPALGELLFLVAKQEEQKSAMIDAWTVPSVTYTIITRCLREGEEAPVQHYAALIFANVATTDGVHSEKLCSNETAQLLWHLFTHCTADALKVTAISALCRLTRHSVSVFQAVIDKIGLPVVLDALSVTINKVQQAMVTMFIATLVDGVHLQRIVQDKDLVLRLMKLLDATSIITRAKAFLAVLEIMKSSTDMILVACQARLVMYIERDSRRQNGGKQETNWEYLNKCLSLTTNYLVEVLPQVMGDAVQSLESVAGRRHPSTLQAKQLKSTLPLLPVSLHLITSQIFRARVADEQFVTSMGELVSHLKLIDSGETNIDPAIGRSGTEEYIDTVLSIVEAITQHPGILMQYQEAIIVSVYPHLAQLVTSDNGNTKALCLHILVEITSLYLNHKHLVEEAPTSDTHEKIIYEIINEHVMEDLERVLLEPDPFPAYALKLMLALVQRNPDFVRKIQELSLVQVLFQVLVDHQQVPTSSAMCLVLNIFQCLITDQSCIPELFELGLVRYIVDLFNAASQLVERQDEKSDNKSVLTLIHSLLETLNTALKHVAVVVRQVLQAKQAKKEAATNLAEDLLLNLKPVVQLIDNLTALICLCENDSQVLVCNCLSLLAQLYGGEYQDAMSVKNMDNIAAALRHVDVKKQKILLRFVKRMITTDKHHADQLVGEGDRLVDALTWLVHNANSQADVAVASLASDILKAADIKQK
ncbi:serine/threonine-protein kinase ULK4-like isoform X2 [Anneissia japonica]|uniref:serine/threonine-protein kinase ULK4-like isoform X2 n=1 Tax=Anneissia japonica TaxID=1529436 RepID=UPI0014256942|nr:serine/threonine-protein kinase ULK4-like isoform X2 [Anneissia japonica]